MDEWDHETIKDYLLICFDRVRDDYTLRAAADETKRWNLRFLLDYENINTSINKFGGTVNYNKKQRTWNFIEYSDKRNWSVKISLLNPDIYCPANPLFYEYTYGKLKHKKSKF